MEIAELLPRQGPPVRIDMVAANAAPTAENGEFSSGMYNSAVAVGDPRFQFIFATACFHSGQVLPGKVDDKWIRRAYRLFTHPHLHDLVLRQAFRIFLQNGHVLAHRINALVAGDAPRDIIAEFCDKDVEVIEAYENLFFDVRDRRKNQMWMSGLVFPDGCFYDSACGSRSLRMMQIAYDHGWQKALDFMGIKNTKAVAKSTPELSQEYVHNSYKHAHKASLDMHAIPIDFYFGQAKTWIGAEAAGKAAGVGTSNPNQFAAEAGVVMERDLTIQTHARLARTVDLNIGNQSHERKNIPVG